MHTHGIENIVDAPTGPGFNWASQSSMLCLRAMIIVGESYYNSPLPIHPNVSCCVTRPRSLALYPWCVNGRASWDL